MIKWFKPSEKLVEDFKNIFPKEKCPNNFHELLDDFLQNHNNLLESVKVLNEIWNAIASFKNYQNVKKNIVIINL